MLWVSALILSLNEKFLSCHLLPCIVHLQLEDDKKLDLLLITCFRCVYEGTSLSVPEFNDNIKTQLRVFYLSLLH